MLFWSDVLVEQGRGGSRNAVGVDDEDRASRRPAPAAAAFRAVPGAAGAEPATATAREAEACRIRHIGAGGMWQQAEQPQERRRHTATALPDRRSEFCGLGRHHARDTRPATPRGVRRGRAQQFAVE